MTDRARNVWGVIGQALFVLSIFVAFGCAYLMGRFVAARELGGAAHAAERSLQPVYASRGWSPQDVQNFGESVLGIAYACQDRKMPEPACQKFLAYVLANKVVPDRLND